MMSRSKAVIKARQREPHWFTDMEISRDQERDGCLSDKLEDQFLHLERVWESYKRSQNPLSPHRYFDPPSSSTSIVEGLRLLEDSPRALMASLQRGASSPPSRLPLRLTRRHYDVAAEEVVNDRRAAIQRGRLKGCRRLFHARAEGTCCSLSDLMTGSGSEAEGRSIASYRDSISSNDDDDDEAGDLLGNEAAKNVIPRGCCSPSAATSPPSSPSVHDKLIVLAMVDGQQRMEQRRTDDHHRRKSKTINTGPGYGLLRLGPSLRLKREFLLVVVWLTLLVACVIGRHWTSGRRQVISLPKPT